MTCFLIVHSLVLNVLLSYQFSGPPVDFCIGRSDGAFNNPANLAQYFYCNNGKASECNECDFGVFKNKCELCLPFGTRKFSAGVERSKLPIFKLPDHFLHFFNLFSFSVFKNTTNIFH